MNEAMVNYEAEANEAEETMVATEKTEAPAVKFLKRFGIGAILVFAGYGVYSAVKDISGAIKETQEAGGIQAIMAQKKIEKEKAKEAKENQAENKKN